jgi:hypothetical protein
LRRSTPGGGNSTTTRQVESHLGAVELAEFRVAKKTPMQVLIHRFKADFFVAESSLMKIRSLRQLISSLLLRRRI